MHPTILQQLAAEHVKDRLAAADDARRVRQARGTGGHEHPAAHPRQSLR
jgi:hypothetical protein